MVNLIPIGLVSILYIIFGTQCLSIQDHTRLTEDKRMLLEKFRSIVLPKLTKDYMKDDLYLLRFLEAKKFDLEKAELMLLNNLQFREENKIDGIQEEDFSDLEQDYPYRIDGLDKLGRPVVEFDFGKWDINKAAESGQHERLQRYYDKMLEEATMKVIDLQSQGKNVTQWTWLVNLQDVGLNTHINFKSSRFYFDTANTLENYYPGMASNILLLNSPPIFETVMYLSRSLMSPETNDRFKEYGHPEDWKPIVDNLVDPDQLPVEYGGTKGSKYTPTLLVGAYERRKDGSWWFWPR